MRDFYFLIADNGSDNTDKSIQVSLQQMTSSIVCFCPVSLCGVTSLTICKDEVRAFQHMLGTISAFIQQISHSNADPVRF